MFLVTFVYFFLKSTMVPKLQGRFSQNGMQTYQHKICLPIHVFLFHLAGGLGYVVKLALTFIVLSVLWVVRKCKRRRNRNDELNQLKFGQLVKRNAQEVLNFTGTDSEGQIVLMEIKRHHNGTADIQLVLRMKDGTVLTRQEQVMDEVRNRT